MLPSRNPIQHFYSSIWTSLNTQSSSLFHMDLPHHLPQMSYTLCLETPYLFWNPSYTPPPLESLLWYNSPMPNLAKLALNLIGLELQTSLPHLQTGIIGVCHLVGRKLKFSKLLLIPPLLPLTTAAGQMNVTLQPCWNGSPPFRQCLFYFTSHVSKQLQMSHGPVPRLTYQVSLQLSLTNQ